MLEPQMVLKFEKVTSILKSSIETKLIRDLDIAKIKLVPFTKKLENVNQLTVIQNGEDLVATLVKPGKEPVRYPLTPGRCYSDAVLGIVREVYNLDKHEKGVREILQKFQLQRLGMYNEP